VATFWNLAMYDADNFFVDNPLGRYTIGSTTDGLQPDPDGSLTITIQHQPPADTSNWLPAPGRAVQPDPAHVRTRHGAAGHGLDAVAAAGAGVRGSRSEAASPTRPTAASTIMASP
jgi:hypothetical protein